MAGQREVGGALPMRMTKAEAAAGMWLDGRETSRGESRHRAPAARTENGKKTTNGTA